MISDIFESEFGYSPELTDFTPGRINLIGEHTDYNGGLVLPTAIPLGLNISIGRRDDDQFRITSHGFKGIFEGNLSNKVSDHWSDYARGAVLFSNKHGMHKGGADIAIQTSLPHGAGLSSSAAITVGILKLLRDLSKATLNDVKISQIARSVENDFIGVPCGIMDQMAVALATPKQALRIDTDSLDYDIIDIPATHHMAVVHSGKFRRLNEGRYKERKEECDAVKAVLGRNDICKMTNTDFETIKHLPDHVQRRARHCATEHQRTQAAATALSNQDMTRFAELMNESHISMRDDFEMSVPEVDTVVESAVACGAMGARLTGGGFGGCIVACVEADKLEDWKSDLLGRHEKAFYVC